MRFARCVLNGVKIACCLLVSLSVGCLDKSDFQPPALLDAEVLVDSSQVDAQPPGERCERVFVYRHPGDRLPSRVQLAGEFEVDPWSARIEMDGPNQAGEYVSTVSLAPGTYLYKFVVDGIWLTDPENPDTSADATGNDNSTLVHTCPFQADCVRNMDCSDAFVCRNFSCVPCDCSNGLVCDPRTKQCVDTIQCESESECPSNQVCRGGQCAQCVEDNECEGAQRCLVDGCGEPTCLTDTSCTVDTQRCEQYECAPKGCLEQNFFLADPNNDFEAVRVAGSFTDWEEGALELQHGLADW